MGLLEQLKKKQQEGGERLSLEDLKPGNYMVESVKFKFYETDDGGRMFFIDNKIDGKSYSTSTLFSGYSKKVDENGDKKYTDINTSVDRLVMYNLVKESKFVDMFINDLGYLIQENGSKQAYSALEQALNDNINKQVNFVNIVESKGKIYASLGYCMTGDDLSEYEFEVTKDVDAIPTTNTAPEVHTETNESTEDQSDIESFAEKLENSEIKFG